RRTGRRGRPAGAARRLGAVVRRGPDPAGAGGARRASRPGRAVPGGQDGDTRLPGRAGDEEERGPGGAAGGEGAARGRTQEARERGLNRGSSPHPAGRLEASKWDAKQVMMEAGIPTAYARAFTTRPAAVAALDDFGPPWVLKADGLASGKGVLVTARRDEAERFLAACLEQDRFGESG